MRARGVCAVARIALVVVVSRAFNRPWATFHLSFTLLGTLSDSGLYLALEGLHLPFTLYSQTALLPLRDY